MDMGQEWRITPHQSRGRTHGTISCSKVCKDINGGVTCDACRKVARERRALYRRLARERRAAA